jgi:DNA-binding transcriptional ArsR family regulator
VQIFCAWYGAPVNTAAERTPITTLRLDPKALRVLAHPLRSRLLTALRSGGPATATALAGALGTNTGATSYHLRRLAGVGLVTEQAGGKGRERWWRATTDAHDWTERDVAGDAEAAAASDWLKRHYLRTFLDRYERWLDTAEAWPIDWRAAAESGDTILFGTPADLAAFQRDLLELFDRYRKRSSGAHDARRVEFYYHAFPSDDSAR